MYLYYPFERNVYAICGVLLWCLQMQWSTSEHVVIFQAHSEGVIGHVVVEFVHRMLSFVGPIVFYDFVLDPRTGFF